MPAQAHGFSSGVGGQGRKTAHLEENRPHHVEPVSQGTSRKRKRFTATTWEVRPPQSCPVTFLGKRSRCAPLPLCCSLGCGIFPCVAVTRAEPLSFNWASWLRILCTFDSHHSFSWQEPAVSGAEESGYFSDRLSDSFLPRGQTIMGTLPTPAIHGVKWAGLRPQGR